MFVIERSIPSGIGTPGTSSEPSIDISGLNPTVSDGTLPPTANSTSTSSATLPPATTLPGPSAGMPMAATLSPEHLRQIAGAVADIVWHHPSENPLVTSALSATVTDSSEGTVRLCTLITVILLIMHIYIGVYR